MYRESSNIVHLCLRCQSTQNTCKFYVYVADIEEVVPRIHSDKNAAVDENEMEVVRVVVTSDPRPLIRTQITDVTRKSSSLTTTTFTTALVLTLSTAEYASPAGINSDFL